MTISTLLLVLMIAVAVAGTVYALTNAVVRGDGQIGPGRSPAPPRSHPADTFESAMRRLS